ncbi:MAG TPA: T9SS type A sorting domain-containing protein [Ignavibacteria bacterium]
MKTKFTLLAAFILLISCQYALAFTPSDNEVNSWIGTPVAGFIENKGQLCDVNYNPAPYLLFKLQDRGTDIYITDRGLSYVFKFSEEKPQNIAAGDKDNPGLPDDKFEPKDIIIHYCRADMELAGADIRKENIIKEFESTDYFNYYLSHCPEGVTEVRSYGKITIKEVYPGIDWVIYNTASGGMKYDFVVHPYADPSQIKLRYKWTDKPQENIMEQEGSITIATPLGKITEGKPYGFNSGSAVDVSYYIEDRDISFQTGEYNPAETLIIDPQLLWATYYGGNSWDNGYSIQSDGTSVWVTGRTQSSNFPLQSLSGAYNQGTIGGSTYTYDAYMLKFNTSGVRQWATYYGGNGDDIGYSIYSDGISVWVTGSTTSTDFPLQSLSGAYNQGTYGGGTYEGDAFILRFSISGVRQWATYYGGTSEDDGYSIHSDGTSVWVTGRTQSSNFPLQSLSGAYNQGTFGGGYDAFILEFSTSCVRAWATYYGGNSPDNGKSIHSDGTSVWVTGGTTSTDFPLQSLSGAYNQGTLVGSGDAFILRFSTSGVRQWATYYGGNNDEGGYSIHSDGTSVWITGSTSSTDFPLQNLSGAYNQGTNGGGSDVFILKFSTSGVRQWATYYGGTTADIANSIHSQGTSVWVIGTTNSTNFPLQNLPGAYNQGTYGGTVDAFILEFSTSGVRHWATYYGGTGSENGYCIHSDGTSVWVTGHTSSSNFPLQSLSGAYNQGTFGGGGNDAFIAEFTAAITGIRLISNEIPSSYSLSQNYPNPFNPRTVVRFQLSVVSNVVLKVYDVMGREVQTLVNEKLSAGTYEVTFDGSNLTSGIYFYKLTAGNFVETKRMILIK